MPSTRKPADAGADLARAALLEHCDEETVGEHAGMQLDDSGLIIHEFTCTMQGYPNWLWTVVLAHDTDTDTLSVCDAVLLPAEGALVPPAWVPWSSRVQPGDLRPGDLLPSDPHDPRLAPGFEPAKSDATDEPDVLEAVWELGLGRERVLSPEGRDSASHRWWRGDTGPSAPDARLAPNPCSTCGFFIGIKGSLGAGFGVCANEISPADGRVVSVAFGCGAHSGIVIESSAAALPQVTLDENEYDSFSLDVGTDEGQAEPGAGNTAAGFAITDAHEGAQADGDAQVATAATDQRNSEVDRIHELDTTAGPALTPQWAAGEAVLPGAHVDGNGAAGVGPGADDGAESEMFAGVADEGADEDDRSDASSAGSSAADVHSAGAHTPEEMNGDAAEPAGSHD